MEQEGIFLLFFLPTIKKASERVKKFIRVLFSIAELIY